jgi:CBS domain containing-hemolysin-like protein
VVSETGDVVGLVNVLDVAMDERSRGVVETYQRRIVKVNAGEPAHSIVRKLRAARISMAVVIDSSGRQLGIVTWEDLIRRLVTVAVA